MDLYWKFSAAIFIFGMLSTLASVPLSMTSGVPSLRYPWLICSGCAILAGIGLMAVGVLIEVWRA